jgi:plasmid stability protein
MKPMTLRLSDELHAKLKAEAAVCGRSLHAHILWLVDPARGIPRRILDPPVTPTPTQPIVAVSSPFDLTEGVVYDWQEVCTCGPGERAKGRHNKYCPLRGK